MPVTKINPVSQTINWNRSGVIPGVLSLNLTYGELTPLFSAQVEFSFSGTSVEWLKTPNIDNYFTIDSPEHGTLPLQFQNVSSLPNGSYSCLITTSVYDTDFNLVRTLYSNVYFNLSGVEPTAITTDQLVYNVFYRSDTDTLSGETLVTILNNSGAETLEFERQGTLFKDATFTTDFLLEDNPAAPFSTNSELPVSGLQVVYCRLKKDDVYIHSFQVHITVFESDEIQVNPGEFDFLLRKGLNETKSATLHIVNPFEKEFTIVKPSWLNLSAVSGDESAEILIETVNSDTMEVGEYSGFIEISYASKVIKIPVHLTVITFVEFDAPVNDFALDIPPVKINRMNDQAKTVRIVLSSNFETLGVERIQENIFEIPYMNGKVSFDLGDKIHSYFPEIEEVPEIGIIRKSAMFGFKVEELDFEKNMILESGLYGGKLFPGKKPKAFPLLSNYLHRSKSKGAIANYSVVENDDIEFSSQVLDGIDSVDFGDQTIAFYDLPDNYTKIPVMWINQNLVPEWAFFNGNFAIGNDYSHIANKSVFNGKSKKFGFSRGKTIKVSTGFILKYEEEMISEIVESPLAFIFHEGKVYKCYCVSQKIETLNTDSELISKELEFTIIEVYGS